VIYGLAQSEFVLATGCLINGAIYGRNLWIAGHPNGTRLGRVTLNALGTSALIALGASALLKGSHPSHDSWAWLGCSLIGQGLWSTRFVMQWWQAERVWESRLDAAFWWSSLAGNVLLLAYAAHLGDLVYLAGFLPGPLVQVRNIVLHRRASTPALTIQPGSLGGLSALPSVPPRARPSGSSPSCGR
jgi:lipid-A-disaccharide synthase-like uncharacterized protein